MLRFVPGIAALAVLLTLAASAGAAGNVTFDTPTVNLDPTGDTVTVSGTGFTSGEVIAFQLNANATGPLRGIGNPVTPASVQADGHGTFSVPVSVAYLNSGEPCFKDHCTLLVSKDAVELNSAPIGFTEGADLVVVGGAGGSATAGTAAEQTYTVTATGDAQDVVFQTRFISGPGTNDAATSSQGAGCGDPDTGNDDLITCNLGTLADGHSATVTLSRDIPANAPAGFLSSSAVAFDSAGEPTPDDNTDPITTTIVPAEADLAGTISTPSTHPIAGGDAFTVTIGATNTGPADNTGGYSVSMALTDGLTFVDDTDGCGAEGGTVTCSTSEGLAKDASSGFDVHLTAAASVAHHHVFHLSATATSNDGTDSNGNNDTAGPVDVTVDRDADLSATLGVPSDDPIAGDPDGFDLHLGVANGGPSDNGGYTTSITLPAKWTYDDAHSNAACDASGQVVTCTSGGIAHDDAPASFTVHVTTDPSIPDSTTYHLHSSVTSAGDPDTHPANNTVTPDEDVTVIARADLEASVSAASPQVAGGPNFTITIGVQNHGPSDNAAPGFHVDVPVASGISLVSSTPAACVVKTNSPGRRISCADTDGLTVADGSDTFVVTVSTSPSIANGLPALSTFQQSLQATVTVANGGTVDPKPGNNSSSATTVDIQAHADLSASLSGTPALIWASTTTRNTVTFTSVVHNGGPSDATGVQLSASLSPYLVSRKYCFGAGCTPGSVLTGAVSVGTLNHDDSITVRISARLSPTATTGTTPQGAGTLTTTVTASSDAADDTPGNDSPPSVSTTYHTAPAPPTNVEAFGGNTNAVVSWDAPTDDGGEPITGYVIDVYSGVNAPGTFVKSVPITTPVTVGNVPNLNNGTTYRFTVQAVNDVDAGDESTKSDPVVPSKDTSAAIIGGQVLTQQTAGGSAPTGTEQQIAIQTFQQGTSGIGTLVEFSGSTAFCGGVKCIGNPVVNKLLDAQNTNRYDVTILYDKTIAKGTGTSFTAYFTTNVNASTGAPIAKCPKKIPATLNACVKQLTRFGSNPDLKVVISVRGDLTDPKSGIR